MIVVAIIGLLAALAIYGVRKYMTNSKTAEARQALGTISKSARLAYSGEHWDTTDVLDPGGKAGAANKLCPSAAKVPEGAPPKGEKYQSTKGDWDDDPGWSCLKFEMSGPQYFQYEFVADDDAKTFDAIARGDLNADDATSVFTLKGRVNEDGMLTIAPTIDEQNPDE